MLQLSHQARRTTRLRRATPTLATLTNAAGTTTTAIAVVALVVELAVASSRPLLSHSHSLLRTTTTAHKLLHLTVYYHARTCIHPHTHTCACALVVVVVVVVVAVVAVVVVIVVGGAVVLS